MGLALLGAYLLVVGPEGLRGGALGVAYGLLSAVSFAAYAAFAHGLRTPAFVALGVATGVGALLSLPVLGLHGEKVLALGPAQWGAVAYLVTLGTVVPFGLFLLGVRTLPARTEVDTAGFVGRVVYHLPRATEEEALWLSALGRFAFYSGVGAKTSLGYGRARAESA